MIIVISNDAENNCIQITIKAIVHHPMDWSPSSASKPVEPNSETDKDVNNNYQRTIKRKVNAEIINYDEILPCAPDPVPQYSRRSGRLLRPRRL